MRGLPGEADRTGQTNAPCIARAVVTDQAVAVAESRLLEQRSEEIRTDAGVHQHNRLAGTADLVFQLDPVDRCPPHCRRRYSRDPPSPSGERPILRLSPSVGQVVLHREQRGADAG